MEKSLNHHNGASEARVRVKPAHALNKLRASIAHGNRVLGTLQSTQSSTCNPTNKRKDRCDRKHRCESAGQRGNTNSDSVEQDNTKDAGEDGKLGSSVSNDNREGGFSAGAVVLAVDGDVGEGVLLRNWRRSLKILRRHLKQQKSKEISLDRG
ncbi:hypothetical protein BC829DRAFT_382157 [Chytridium lagenaria]|nr:hypothetical protein BC829DRAFT_382157 [Chytridium lagenaria]